MKAETLLKHVRNDLTNAFPRDFGLYRKKALTANHYLTLCNFCKRFNKCGYTAVYSDYEHENGIATCLYYDIDGKDILDTSKFTNAFLEQIRIYNPTVLYTGGRGYHIFIPFPATKISDLKSASKYFLEQTDGLEIEKYIDPHGIGNWRAICRIPYTKHSRTGFESCIIRIGNITKNNIELAKELANKFGNGNGKIKMHLESIAEPMQIMETNLKELPPCIANILHKVPGGELTHAERMHLTSFLIACGFSDADLHQIFKHMLDYTPSITDYQVKYIRARQLKMFSCPKAIEYNICPFPIQHCKFYPSLNWYYW